MKTPTILRRFAALAVALCLVGMMAFSAFADDANEAVTRDTTGVVQIKVVFIDDDQNARGIMSGTGFLINDSTVVTCNHVVAVDDELLNEIANRFGKSVSQVKDRIQVQISVLRDVIIRATIRTQSAEMDYAVLNLESQLYDRTYLPIRSSSGVQQTETVYALGFPGEVEYFQDVNTYTSADVTITNGQVNKINTVGGVDFIQSSARITSGNSGGPLVDANGNVIGICQGATGSEFDYNYFYAIAIDQLTQTLDSLGIAYTPAGGTPESAPAPAPAPQPAVPDSVEPAQDVPVVEIDKSELSAAVTDAQKLEVKDYDDASGSAFTSALENAQNILSNENVSQEQVNSAVTRLTDAQAALVPKSGIPLWMIAAVAAVVLVIIVAIVLVLTGKKKKTPAVPVGANPGYPAPPQGGFTAPQGGFAPPQGGYAPPQQGGFGAAPMTPQNDTVPVNYGGSSNATTVLNAGGGETTVLNAGSGETTVLNTNTNFGTLVRSKNKERVTINSDNFVIGKERSRVNYCISDNTSISRTHVRFTNRAGVTYITDLKTTNGTFVNGLKIAPNTETALKNKDKITLADEEFVYSTTK